MTSQRAEAYGRLMTTLRSLQGSKLHAQEEETVREAADILFFSDDLEEASVQQALAEFHELTDRLIESERVTSELAQRLTAEFEDCGPLVAVG